MATNSDTEGTEITAKILRVGIVGCGEVTQIMHWPSLSQLGELFEVTALCDASQSIVQTLGKRWNVGFLTTDHRGLVGHADVDVVLVATPNAFHAEVTLAAIAAGKHVLVEKPMCVNRREADEVLTAQLQSPVIVQVGLYATVCAGFLSCL